MELTPVASSCIPAGHLLQWGFPSRWGRSVQEAVGQLGLTAAVWWTAVQVRRWSRRGIEAAAARSAAEGYYCCLVFDGCCGGDCCSVSVACCWWSAQMLGGPVRVAKSSAELGEPRPG